MIDIIPSKQMKEYLKEIGFTLSDHQKATLIWNAYPYTWGERVEALKELAEQTSDEMVKQQVQERVQYEEKSLEVFKDNAMNNYIYVVSTKEDYPEGYFLKVETAFHYAKEKAIENKETYIIYKQLLITRDEIPMVKSEFREIILNMCSKTDWSKEEKYNGRAVSRVEVNSNGEIESIYSNEMSAEEEAQVDEFRIERFEDKFIPMPFPFEKGDIVKYIPTGEYAVVSSSQDDWKWLLGKIGNGFDADYIETSITVVFLDKKGYWSHEHISPLYFEIDTPEVTNENILLCEALKALSEYWRGDLGKEEVVLRTCKEYAKSKEEKDCIERAIENAKAIRDILW